LEREGDDGGDGDGDGALCEVLVGVDEAGVRVCVVLLIEVTIWIRRTGSSLFRSLARAAIAERGDVGA
jgi:hypothetical protein